MLRKIVASLPLFALAAVAPNVHAFTLDQYGGSNLTSEDWDAPKIAPSTACRSLMLYAADTPADASRARRYRFTGECTMNVAPSNRRANMRTFPVLINAEWSPKMKRASETVVVEDPDLAVQLSTWATCASDPFVAPNVSCTNHGMGANKFEAFIRREDAPFAKNRATPGQVDGAVKQVGANTAKLWQNPTLTRIQPIGMAKKGTPEGIRIDVAGGVGLCPLDLDFGDGTKEVLRIWAQDPFTHYVEHTFTKPGAFKVSAKPRPGCTGDAASVYAIVK